MNPTVPATPPPRKIQIAQAVATGLIIAVPAAMANVILAAQHPRPQAWLNLTLLILLLAFFTAGLVVGLSIPDNTARTGAQAALIAFVPIELIGILGRLDRGEHISIPNIVLVGFLAAMAGTMGALFGLRKLSRKDLP